MITKIKEVYYCEYCKKRYIRKDFMERHEKLCYHNPANKRACHGCDALIQKENRIHYTYGNIFGEKEIDTLVKAFYCTVKKIYLHTPQNEIKGNLYDFGDEENHPMQKECNGFLGDKLYG